MKPSGIKLLLVFAAVCAFAAVIWFIWSSPVLYKETGVTFDGTVSVSEDDGETGSQSAKKDSLITVPSIDSFSAIQPHTVSLQEETSVQDTGYVKDEISAIVPAEEKHVNVIEKGVAEGDSSPRESKTETPSKLTEKELGNLISISNSITKDNSEADLSGTEEDKLAALTPEVLSINASLVQKELTPDIIQKHPAGKFKERAVENKTWGVGESLVFSVDYGFYRAGTATMEISGTEVINGGLCYQIKTTAVSNEFISKFYKVNDLVSSYIDIDGIFSRRFEKRLREGKYKSDRFVDFYHDRLIAVSTTQKNSVKEIPSYVQDILSALYYVRTFDLKVGKDVIVEVYADGKIYPLKVKVHKVEKVEVPAGKFNCFVVEPVLQSEGIFRQKGRLLIWLSIDNNKLPVKMTSKIAIGSIGTNLEKYQLGVVR